MRKTYQSPQVRVVKVLSETVIADSPSLNDIQGSEEHFSKRMPTSVDSKSSASIWEE